MVERKQGELALVPGCQASSTPLASCFPHLRVTSRSREPGSEPPKLFVAPHEQSLSEDLTAGLSEATAQAHRLTLGPPKHAGGPALWSGLFPCSSREDGQCAPDFLTGWTGAFSLYHNLVHY